jgi:hypothetical protein
MNTGRPHFCIHLGLYSKDAQEVLMLLMNSDELSYECRNSDELSYEFYDPHYEVPHVLDHVIAVQDSTGETMIVPFWNSNDKSIERAMSDCKFKTHDEFLKHIAKAIKSLVKSQDCKSRCKYLKLHTKSNGESLEDYMSTHNKLFTISKKTAKFLVDWIYALDKDKIFKKYGKSYVNTMIGIPRNIVDVQMLDLLKEELKDAYKTFEIEKSKLNHIRQKALKEVYETFEIEKHIEEERIEIINNHTKLYNELKNNHDAKVKNIRKMIDDIISKTVA